MSERQGVRVSDRDPELLAMKALMSAFEGLDKEQVARVLKWAGARYLSPHGQIFKDIEKSFTQAWQDIDRAVKKEGHSMFDLTEAVHYVFEESARLRQERKREDLKGDLPPVPVEGTIG